MTLRKRLPGFTPGKRRDVDMTEGNITRHIISFALPLLIGNIFQQLYNMVDTWVVGNYVNIQAYSAVGTVGPIVNMLIGFFMGLSSGAGVVISQYYGAQQPDKVKQTVHTALLMTLILGVIFTAVGILMTPTMLKLINMPPDEAKEATTYLTIYFAGILGLMFYNIGAGILRAVGDSQRPFYFLVVSAVMNIVLDLVFVLVFNMGVAGVALATIIAQSTSAVLIIITLLRSDACIKLIPKELKIHWGMLKKIFTVGIPAALQMAITSFSNIFVQSYINYFGGNCMAGWTTYAKVDQLLFLPMQSISLASTTFVGQNLGRNQAERARQGVKISLLLAMGFTAVLTVPVVLFAQPIVTFFIKDSTPEALSFGTLFLQWLSPFYLLCCFNQIYSGALRGAGNSRAPMIIMLSSFVAFRQVYLFIMAIVCNEILPIAMSYPAGWLVCSILTAAYYHKVQLTKTRLVEEQQ
jgi:putative MATE family efflux protein